VYRFLEQPKTLMTMRKVPAFQKLRMIEQDDQLSVHTAR